ncbi:MAG: Gfo/Idh/MocA family oxidoreductase [Clostridia bacterium]|nr:Gfo/Idh/MocA family oxidoreductase [Clostridia bacterium]
MKTLNYAIAGFGAVARNHAMAAYQGALQFEHEVVPVLTGLMSRTPKESPLPGVKHYTDLNLLLQEAKPDFLSLCMPHHLRRDAVFFAAQHELPIYCEKPLAHDLTAAEELVTLAGELPTAMAFEYRFSPAVTLMKRNLHLIGDLIDFKAYFLHDSYLLPRPRTWRMTAENGGGALLDLGVHMLDLLAYLLGPLHYLGGEKGIQFPERNEVDEFGRMELASPLCTGTLEVSRIHATEGSGKTVTLYGERGNLSIDLERPYELRHYDLASRQTTLLRADNGLLAELMYPAPRNTMGFYQDAHTCSILHFARFLYTGEEDPLIPTFRDGLAAQKLLAEIL